MELTLCYASDLIFIEDYTDTLRDFLRSRRIILPPGDGPLKPGYSVMNPDRSGHFLRPDSLTVKVPCDNEGLRSAAAEVLALGGTINVDFDERHGFSDRLRETRPHTPDEVLHILDTWQPFAERSATPTHLQLDQRGFDPHPRASDEDEGGDDTTISTVASQVRSFHPELVGWSDRAAFEAWGDYSSHVLLVNLADVDYRDANFIAYIYVNQVSRAKSWAGHDPDLDFALNALWPPPNLLAGYAVDRSGRVVPQPSQD